MAKTYTNDQLINTLDTIAQNMLNSMQEQFKQTSAVISILNDLRDSGSTKTLGDMVTYNELVSLSDLGLTLN
jgi:hypothetical protein